MIAGITVLSTRLTRVAPGGTFTSAALPTCAKRAPLTMNDALSIGGRPSPTMMRAPSKTVTPAVGACPRAVTDPTATIVRTRPFSRCMDHLPESELYQEVRDPGSGIRDPKLRDSFP